MHIVRSSLFFIAAATAVLGIRSAASAAEPEHATRGAAQPARAETAAPGDSAIAARVRQVLDAARADSAFPGAIAVVGTRTRVITEYGVGHLDWAPSPVPNDHTLWDLASLTKVIGLTSGIMQLVDKGRIDINAPVQRYLPDWTGPNKNLVTIRHLLTHTSGLPADRNYDQITHLPDSIGKLLYTTPLDTLPGVRMVYSDIGAYTLGRVLEQITSQPLDLYLHDHVFVPAGMNETMYNPPAALVPRIAPTEFDPVRGGLVHGKVHDERAYWLGGVSAHAGLFSSAHDLTRFAQMYLNGGVIGGKRVLPQREIPFFTEKTLVADRALGWQKPNGTNSAGHLMSPKAFGHTGFTGTSIWIDPVHNVFIILLTNRVDPTRNNNKIGHVRVALADSVMSVILHRS
jgi:CubicO group peptidase (beta-lactamase class C family)